MNRLILSLRKGLLLFYIGCSCTLSFLGADDLSTAVEYEKSGQISEARTLYLSWLKKELDNQHPSYGRTLLHVLRLGGDSDEILNVLDSYLPGVTNSHDRIEILKFAAYVADLSGKGEKAKEYFSKLQSIEKGEYDWILSYYDVLKGSEIPPEDPLTVFFHTNNEHYVKNKALVYFLYLNIVSADLGQVINWQEQMEGQFPFLKNYPEWLFFNWYFYSLGEKQDRADEYKSILIDNFSNSPETAIAEGRMSLLSNTAFLIGGGNPSTEDLVPATPASPVQALFYLQAGAFGSRANAVSLQKDIKRQTGLSASIIKRGESFKVIIETPSPDKDQKQLTRAGFEVFRIPRL